jgi:hypothetical protein
MAMVKKDAIGQEIRKSYERGQKGCPEATVDIHVNLKNRNNAIKEYGYGPLNPESESRAFWDKKAELWELRGVHSDATDDCLYRKRHRGERRGAGTRELRPGRRPGGQPRLL